MTEDPACSDPFCSYRAEVERRTIEAEALAVKFKDVLLDCALPLEALRLCAANDAEQGREPWLAPSVEEGIVKATDGIRALLPDMQWLARKMEV